jgi:hypothetical protein
VIIQKEDAPVQLADGQGKGTIPIYRPPWAMRAAAALVVVAVLEMHVAALAIAAAIASVAAPVVVVNYGASHSHLTYGTAILLLALSLLLCIHGARAQTQVLVHTENGLSRVGRGSTVSYPFYLSTVTYSSYSYVAISITNPYISYIGRNRYKVSILAGTCSGPALKV